MTQFKYLSNITTEELNSNVVIPCIDEENNQCILIKNNREKIVQSGYSTDNLDIKLNRVLVRESVDYYFHIIKSKKSDSYSKNQFDTIFNYVFKKIESPISDTELSLLVTSLEDYFKMSPESNKREIQIGVFGELLTIKYLYDLGYKEIVNKYHTNFYSKHDLEIDDKLRLEVKTTTSEKRIHHFKHNQIMRKDVSVIVSSVLLEEAKEGCTLKELFEKIKEIFTDPDSLFALDKLMIRCGIIDDKTGMSFSYEKAINNIRFINSEKCPRIPFEDFDGVTDIEYNSDLSTAEYYLNDEIIDLFKSRN